MFQYASSCPASLAGTGEDGPTLRVNNQLHDKPEKGKQWERNSELPLRDTLMTTALLPIQRPARRDRVQLAPDLVRWMRASPNGEINICNINPLAGNSCLTSRSPSDLPSQTNPWNYADIDLACSLSTKTTANIKCSILEGLRKNDTVQVGTHRKFGPR